MNKDILYYVWMLYGEDSVSHSEKFSINPTGSNTVCAGAFNFTYSYSKSGSGGFGWKNNTASASGVNLGCGKGASAVTLNGYYKF